MHNDGRRPATGPPAPERIAIECGEYLLLRVKQYRGPDADLEAIGRTHAALHGIPDARVTVTNLQPQHLHGSDRLIAVTKNA